MIELTSNIDYNMVEGTYKFDDKYVPRVTELLSFVGDNKGLCNWANSLGFRRIRYATELDRTAQIGTYAHEMIEAYMNKLEYDELDPMDYSSNEAINNAYNSFKLWWDDICKHNEVEVVFTEKSLSCPLFGGTLDALIKINGKIYLIDFKTSNHVTVKYFIQLAAYKYMLSLNNIEIDGCIIVQGDKKSIYYTEFFLDLSKDESKIFIDECLMTIYYIANTYMYFNNVTNKFNEIFKEVL